MAREGNLQRTAGRDDYETPPWLVGLLNLEFDFDCDAAATEGNRVAPWWYGPGSDIMEDALSGPWKPGWSHLNNPPFSAVAAFVDHIVAQDTTVALITALAPERRWYQAALTAAQECRQLTRRVQYLIDGKPVVDAHGKRIGNTIGTAVFVFRRGAPTIPGGAPIWMWDAHRDAIARGFDDVR